MLKNLFIASSAVVLVACGGGGGTTTPPPPPPPPPPANQAPVVASANADQNGQVGFDINYDATQGGTTFTDADGDTLTITVTFNPADNGLAAAGGTITGKPQRLNDVTVTVTADDGNGGTANDTFIINVGVDQNAIQAKFNGNIDLTNLPNYENPTIPAYITKLTENGNPVTNAGAILGRVLFYDTALSIDDTISCASCHIQAQGFSDIDVVSVGVLGGETRRHSMRLINTQYANEVNFFWDERAISHEAQETMPLQDFNEHGFSGTNGRPDINDLITKLEALEYYQELFRFAFLDTNITEPRLQLALAQFTKSINSFDSKYDSGRAQVANDTDNFPNFSASENAGKNLFLSPPPRGGAGCFRCHSAPEFDIMPNINGHNGIVAEASDPTLADFTNTRAPTLRDVVKPDGSPNGQMMHNGSKATLRSVIDHYNNIPVPVTEPERTQFLDNIDMRLVMMSSTPPSLNLSEAEKQQLEDFLKTLTGSNVYTDPKWSSPF
ncbi:MAG: hypothetical protein L3J65_06060 [Robiginitomaculum sp.]|nr:hypothetical protein [Robiginitomaculum sp.]